MIKKIRFLVLVVLMFTVLLSACTLPATRANTAEATATSEIPFPVGTQSQVMKDIVSATQTAMALQSQPLSTPTVASAPADTAGTVAPTEAVLNTPAAVVNTPTATLIPYATATPGRQATYTVQEGEWIYCLARRFDVDPNTLASANGLSGSFLSPGKVLTIPQSGSFPGTRALLSHPTTYTAKAGDTIYTIACAYGDVDPNAIIGANGLTAPYALTPGKVLQIP